MVGNEQYKKLKLSESMLDALNEISEQNLFDAEFYINKYPDVKRLNYNPIEHYVRSGDREGRQPNKYFEPKKYREKNKLNNKENSLLHYIKNENKDSLFVGDYFDISFYLKKYSDVKESGMDPLYHYMTFGAQEGRIPKRVEQKYERKPTFKHLKLNGEMRSALEVIQASGLFDETYYLTRYKDVARNKYNPLEHYVRSGDKEGRNPNEAFDTKYFRDNNSIPKEKNALEFYINHKNRESLKVSERYDGNIYRALNEDVASKFDFLLDHYLKYGISEGRPSSLEGLRELLSTKNRAADKNLNVYSYVVAQPKCTIIIPIYNAPEEVDACIKSVLENTDMHKHNIILSDDCSPDDRVGKVLDKYREMQNVTVVRHEKNLGYTRNINRAINHVDCDSDVLLLNSDTLVSEYWLRNMQVAAYQAIDIGTVTAVSNNAGAFSVPKAGTNDIPENLTISDMADIVSKTHSNEYVDVPTGNGFCFYIKREVLNDIGMFNEEVFPKGYGEENDFSMRARISGWRNIVDFKTYVYHVRTASFGDSKTQLIKYSSGKILEMYPDYKHLVKQIAKSKTMQHSRSKIEKSLNKERDKYIKKPRIMYVLSTMTGGTPQTNRDLMKGVSENYDSLVLSCDRNNIKVLELKENSYVEKEIFSLNEPIFFAEHGSSEYREIVASILFKYNIDILHIRHIAWHDLKLPEIAKKLDLKVVYSLHDFYTICPSVNLLDSDSNYTPGGADKNIANPLWKDDTCLPVDKEYKELWRSRMQDSLQNADKFITTNSSSKEILQTYLPLLKERDDDFLVIPHGRSFDEFFKKETRSNINETQKINILVPGNIGHSKGARLIREIKENDKDDRFIFHVLGKCVGFLNPYVINHGEYTREEFDKRVKEIRPDISAVFSIWPETYCHTLTESWANGLPVIAVNLGAVGDRISRRGGGWLCDDSSSSIINVLNKIIEQPNEISTKKQDIKKWQEGYGLKNTVGSMAKKYECIYSDLML
ncbi:glycosyltransferase [Vibrio astriarenae]